MISSLKINLTVTIAIAVITGFGNAKKVVDDDADAKSPAERCEPKRDDLCMRDILLTGFYADNVEMNCVFVHMLRNTCNTSIHQSLTTALPMQNMTTNESYGYRYGRVISSNLSKKVCAFPKEKWCVMNVPRKEFNECLGLRRPNEFNANMDEDRGEDDDYESFHDDYNEPPKPLQQTSFNNGSDDDDDDGFNGSDDSKYFDKLYQEYYSSFDENIDMSKNIKRKDFIPCVWCATECINELKLAGFNVEENTVVANKMLMLKKFKNERPSNFVNNGLIEQAKSAFSNQNMNKRPYKKYGYVDRFGVKILTLSKMDPQENGIEWCKKTVNHILKNMNVPKYGRVNDGSPDTNSRTS